MHSSRMCTARSSSRDVGRSPHPPRAGTPPEQSPPPRAGIPPPDPPQLTPWVWAWKPARHAGIPPLWRPAARHAGIPPAMHAGIAPPPTHPPPLWTEFLTHASENTTLPQTSFAGGKNDKKSKICTTMIFLGRGWISYDDSEFIVARIRSLREGHVFSQVFLCVCSRGGLQSTGSRPLYRLHLRTYSNLFDLSFTVQKPTPPPRNTFKLVPYEAWKDRKQVVSIRLFLFHSAVRSYLFAKVKDTYRYSISFLVSSRQIPTRTHSP